MTKKQGVLICVPLYTVSVLILGASITAGIFMFHVAVVPLIFKYSRTFRRGLVFGNFVQWPLCIDYEDPSTYGIEGGRNISIEYRSEVDRCAVKIGIWHILPKNAYERMKGCFEENSDKDLLSASMDRELANSKTPIILYCHGNSNSRAASHRIELYNFFQQMDFHTITFDYRGYGDSTYLTPTEAGVVEDSLMVYEWLQCRLSQSEIKPPVYVWGHSLGTGISSHLLGNLISLSTNFLDRSNPLPLPNGLILEAPFNNIADEVSNHPLTVLVKWLPYFDRTFVAPFRSPSTCEHMFCSDSHLLKVPTLPVLILHARDDVIVPYVVGHKLYTSVKESRMDSDAPVTIHSYDKSEDLGHKWICRASDLEQVVGDFVKQHQ